MWTKTIVIILSAINSVLIYSQDCKVDFTKLPQLALDYSFSPLNKIFEQSPDCKIIFSEGLDTIKFKKVTSRLTGWFLNDKTIKEFQFSSNLKSIEPDQNYLFIGLLNDFPRLRDYKLPLSLKNGVWSFGNILLDGRNDAIVIINKTSNCLAVLGNSQEAIESISFRWLGYFDFYILKDNAIKYFGNLKNGRYNSDYLVDLGKIRRDNYSRIYENDFINARFSCSIMESGKYKSTLDSLNQVFQQFCSLLKINMPSEKLDYFIHKDPGELNIVCGSPRPGTTGGLVIDGLIHSVGMNLDLLIHEGVHYIFLSNIKFRDQFFNEGIPGFFGLYRHPEQVAIDSRLILDYQDKDFKSLITGQTDFFKGPYKNGQCISYQISGLFVKYLVETYGIDKTIDFYKDRDLKNAFENTFNKELDSIIIDWRLWLSIKSNNTNAL
jgi:hypothetical protein